MEDTDTAEGTYSYGYAVMMCWSLQSEPEELQQYIRLFKSHTRVLQKL